MGYFEIVNNVTESDTEFHIPPSLAKELGEIHTAILEGEPMVHQLKMLKQQYPQYPQIINMLSLAYMEKEDFERAYQVNREAYMLFPDYIFSRVNMMQEFINKDDLEKAAAIFDPASTIDEVFPKRKQIHSDEYIGFQKTRALYYAHADQPEEFLDVVQSAEGRIEDEIVLLQFRSAIMEMIDSYDLEEYDIISDYTNTVNDELNEQLGITDDDDFDTEADNSISYDKEIQTEEPPSFFFPEEIKPLYDYEFNIPEQAVETLLALPLKELTDDLCEVLNDAVRRYEYYSGDVEEETNMMLFPWHAMNLLRTINAETAVPSMLNFLKQGEALNDFYMGDLITEALWQMFYPFCITNKKELITFLMLPNIYAFVKLPVIHAFTQFSLHNEAQKTEVGGILGQLISFYMERKEDDDFIDPAFMEILCEEVIDGSFAQLKLLVKTVYDNQLVDGWYTDYKAWEEEYNSKRKELDPKKPILNWKELNVEMATVFDN